MGMNKERWIQSYECAVEDIMDVMELEREEAVREIDRILERDPCYLDEYHYNRLVDIAECYGK